MAPAVLSLGALAAGLLAAVLAGLSLGAVAVPPAAVLSALASLSGGPGADDPRWQTIVLLIRLPRVLGAALVGGSLAVAGAALQSLLRNPMADPGVLGVTAGAGFGAVLAIGAGGPARSPWLTPLAAALGALGSAGLILALSLRRGRVPVLTLILAGLAVSTFFAAGTSLALSFLSRDNVSQFLLWAMGSLYNLRWEALALLSLPLGLCTAALLLFGRDLNVLLLGEAEARAVGVSVARTRTVVLAVTALITAGTVSLCGPIGFVGLLVPHGLRRLVGPDNRRLLPASALGGALFLVVCDTGARTAFGAQELNVGIVTALLGAPYFMVLLLRRGGREAAL